MKQSVTPSPVSLATAEAMRRFDTRLTQDDVAEIARAIEENALLRATLHSKKRPIDNGVAPIAVVRVLP